MWIATNVHCQIALNQLLINHNTIIQLSNQVAWIASCGFGGYLGLIPVKYPNAPFDVTVQLNCLRDKWEKFLIRVKPH